MSVALKFGWRSLGVRGSFGRPQPSVAVAFISPDPRPGQPSERALPAIALSSDRVAMPFAKALRGRHLLVIDLVGIVLAAYLALALRIRPDHRADPDPGLPVDPLPPDRRPHHDQYRSRAVQQALALRERARPRANRGRRRRRVAGEHRDLLRRRDPRECRVGSGVPALVLADRGPPGHGHLRGCPVRREGGVGPGAGCRPRERHRSAGNAPLWRRPRRRPAGSLRCAGSGCRSPARGVPRR